MVSFLLGFCYIYNSQKTYYLERPFLKLHLKVDSEYVFQYDRQYWGKQIKYCYKFNLTHLFPFCIFLSSITSRRHFKFLELWSRFIVVSFFTQTLTLFYKFCLGFLKYFQMNFCLFDIALFPRCLSYLILRIFTLYVSAFFRPCQNVNSRILKITFLGLQSLILEIFYWNFPTWSFKWW